MKTAKFDNYRAAIRAAMNAMHDGYNTIIHECTMHGETSFINEYFVRDNEREIHE